MADPFKEALKGALYQSYEDGWVTDWMPTGVIPVDRAIGDAEGGGFGEGRVHEIFGDWSTGKTLLLYQWLINMQRLGAATFLFEGEGSFNPEWFARLGGLFDTGSDNDLYVYPDLKTVEDFFHSVKKIIETVKKQKIDRPIAIGWDSIAATGTKHLEKEGVDGSRDMTKAYQMSQGCAWLSTHLTNTRVGIVATNQSREKIGAQKWEPTHTPGGRAYPYLSSARIELRLSGGPKGSQILTNTEDGKEVAVGRWVRGEVVKNKMGTPLRTFKLPLYTEAGMPHPVFEGSLTEVGIDQDEALLTWYLDDPRAVFENDGAKCRYMTMQGGGYIQIHDALFGMSVKKFRKKDWKKVLGSFPQLRQHNPRSE